MIQQKGYALEICTSYHELKDKIDFSECDLMLLDLNIKDIRGLELFQIAKGIDPDMKIIRVNDHIDHPNISKAKELSAYKSRNIQLFQVMDRIMETM
jgi:DNA-binding NtrC family response regulator